MWTLEFKAQPTNAFFATANQMFAAPPSFRLLPSMLRSNRCAEFRQRTEFASSRKLEGPAEHLIDGSEKRIHRLSFKF